MAEDKLPYYKRFPRDYLSDENVALMSLEEVGELSEAVLEHRFGDEASSFTGFSIRREAIQVAAVAVAICEHLDIEADA